MYVLTSAQPQRHCYKGAFMDLSSSRSWIKSIKIPWCRSFRMIPLPLAARGPSDPRKRLSLEICIHVIRWERPELGWLPYLPRKNLDAFPRRLQGATHSFWGSSAACDIPQILHISWVSQGSEETSSLIMVLRGKRSSPMLRFSPERQNLLNKFQKCGWEFRHEGWFACLVINLRPDCVTA